LSFAYSAFCSKRVNRSTHLLLSAVHFRTLSAFTKCNLSSRSCSLTGTAFPPSGLRIPKFGCGFPQLSVLCSSLTSAGPSVFVSPTTYRFRGPQQISLGNAKRLRLPSRRQYAHSSNEYRASSLPADSPTMDALRRFTFVRYSCSPTASSRLPLAGPQSPFGSRFGLVLQAGALAPSVSDSLR
jgi:hypothetical protein